jgi:NAD(P)-dependent dehydrogenase (short-subunit alcohol dehydrogenase family)
MNATAGTVLVTGAVGGMGSECARSLAETFPLLLLTDRDPDALAAVAAEVVGRGAACRTLACDLSDDLSIATLTDAVRDAGGLRALVHAAGISPSMADWRTVIGVNLVATARLLEALLPLASEGTAAVCIASIAAHQGRPVPPGVLDALADPLRDDLVERLAESSEEPPTSALAYIWSKLAVVGLCEALARPWGARGARIVSLSPGIIDTPMGRMEQEVNPATRPMVAVTPLERARRPGQSELPGRCEDIASTVAFLCSDDAGFISGCDIRVDGGFIGAWRYPDVAT